MDKRNVAQGIGAALLAWALAAGPARAAGAVERDPFSPIGYRRPEQSEAAARPAPVPEPSPDRLAPSPARKDLMARVRADLRVSGILRRGSCFVATVNGKQVQAGDRLDVLLDGVKLSFLVKSISLKRVEIEPLE